MKTNTIKKGFLLALIAIQSFWAPAALAETLNVRAYATDTVAGYPSALRTSLITPSQDVRFVVEKPNGEVVQIPAQADLEGVAKADFFGHQTKTAGKYRVTVVFPGAPDASPVTPFTVFPDQVSTTQSTLRTTEPMVAAGESIFLVATLFDAYQNPIANHQVKLISSRSEDLIDALQNGVTDQNGRANFKIRSKYAGVSVFTAMDTTVNLVLSDRAEVVFYEPVATTPKSSFFSGLKADIGQGTTEVLPGPVDHFDLESLPAGAKPGQALNMTVVAKDKNNNVAKNYTGTILISAPEDENATLPASGQYTFKDTDQGRFTFNLSLIFTKLGKQSVQVFDKNNFRIAGEGFVEVAAAGAPGPVAADLIIKSPTDGAELGSTLIVLSGQAKGNINLKVFMDDTKVGDTESDTDGFFTFEAKDIESGMHSFYVMSDEGTVSKPLNITVDTLAPVLNSFEIFPEGTVNPGEQVTLTLTSESKLPSVKVRFQGTEQTLTESAGEPGKYSATVTAPSADGSFPVDVILVDTLGNKAEIANKGTLAVLTPKPVNPAKVEGLEGQPGDALIALKWTPVANAERPIQKYRIAYGITLSNLDEKAETQDSTASWELRGLTNGTQYFISVKAVDSQGLESLEPSLTIAATPVAPPAPEPEPQPLPVGPATLQATPMQSAVLLEWPAFPGVQAYFYKIFIGVEPGSYIDYAVTRDNSTTFTVQDLMNGQPYYFAIAALDLSGNVISAVSSEAQATPSGIGFHPSAPGAPVAEMPYTPPSQMGSVPAAGKTGPETIYLMLVSLLFAHFFYHHKKKMVAG